jgi:hypothetical protein
VAGDYDVELTVTDGIDTDTDTVRATGEEEPVPNNAPVADAGPNQGVVLPATVDLNGIASEDPDGDILTFVWTFATVPKKSALVDTDIGGAATPFASFEPDVVGTYLIDLDVSDGSLGDTDQVMIEVDSK